MTSLIDTEVNVADLGNVEKDLREAVAGKTDDAAAAAKTETSAGPKKPDNIPDKFWDAEAGVVKWDKLAESYTNLESTLGRMANDLGTQRKLTDKLLDLKRTEDLQRNEPAPTPIKVTAQDLLDKPAETLESVITQVVAKQTGAVQQRVQTVEQQLAAQAFTQNHPDYQQIAGTEEFNAWLRASPYRTRAAAAAYQGDWTAANELLTEYKAVKATASRTGQSKADADAAAKAAADAAAAAALESGSQQTGESRTPTQAKGKVYRRADLIRLKVERPDVYNDPQFQDEILRAYQENRVK